MLCLYVDLLITYIYKKEIGDFKVDLSRDLEMYDLGNISYILEV